ncbi:Fe-S cluster assembly protein SufB [Candidatus Woesearchaeota archaeon]|nr:Fe-S cluster assembly protein SufB [Candidatus Woesearchaeota archaeon]
MIKTEKERQATEMSYDKYDFRYDTNDYQIIFNRGLNKDVVKEISRIKNEPEWMTEFRLKGLKSFFEKPMPQWGANLNDINFDNIIYYMKPSDTNKKNWDDVPSYVKETFDKLGIPEAERKFLAGVGGQIDSEVIYHNVKKEFEEKGIVFLSMDEGLKQYPELVKKYFGTVIPYNDNKFAALNTATWSGGSYVYIPKNVKVDLPLQAYFRINAADFGQFERTLIIADEGSQVSYLEGCTAPRYSSESLHSAVVEIIALPGSKVQYITIQNWASNIYNLVTKRAFAYKDASVYWIDCNLGSKVTMKYPSIYLLEEGARGEVLSVAFAGNGQHQDAGAKIIHVAPNTTSTITSKSISKSSGRATYRGLLKVYPNAKNIKSSVKCDALLIDKESRTDTYPTIEIEEPDATVTHEATVGKIGEDQIFYLTSRGLSEAEATTLIVLGFVQPFTKSLPMEYAVEFNRLIELEMEGSVG